MILRVGLSALDTSQPQSARVRLPGCSVWPGGCGCGPAAADDSLRRPTAVWAGKGRRSQPTSARLTQTPADTQDLGTTLHTINGPALRENVLLDHEILNNTSISVLNPKIFVHQPCCWVQFRCLSGSDGLARLCWCQTQVCSPAWPGWHSSHTYLCFSASDTDLLPCLGC